jgi:hypothetical protein
MKRFCDKTPSLPSSNAKPSPKSSKLSCPGISLCCCPCVSQRMGFHSLCNLVHSFKDVQQRYVDALAAIKTLRAENHHLLHQRDELEMRLTFVGSSSASASVGSGNGFTAPSSTRAGQTVDRMTEEKYWQQVASARAETEVVRGMLNDALRDCGEKDKEISRLRESLAESEGRTKEIQNEYELLQTLMFPGA